MSDQEPLIKLDPDGQPPTVSYRVPDAVAYSGRHYIELDLEPGDFLPEYAASAPGTGPVKGTDLSVEAAKRVIDPTGRTARSAAVSLLAAPSEEGVQRAAWARSGFYARPEADAAPGRVLYAKPELSQEHLDDGNTATGTGPPVAVVEVAFDSPVDGAMITSIGLTASITISGTASFEHVSGQTEVQVQVDGGAWQSANRVGGSWDAWTFDATFVTSGAHTIRARARAGTRQQTETISVRVELQHVPTASGDATPPTLRVTEPLDGAVVLSGGAPDASVTLRGTASDPAGIRAVTVLLPGTTVPLQVQPGPGNDWSAFSAAVRLAVGDNELTVSALDNAGNANSQKLAVRVLPRGKRLTCKLVLVETYRLSSFVGRYGAGRVLKTMTLLPGEEHTISVKSYLRNTEKRKMTQSILDSVGDQATNEFTDNLATEQSSKENYQESLNWSVAAHAEGSWGWGKASLRGSVGGGTNAAREQFGKSVMNATQKHAASVSSKRDVQINSESESSTEQGEETVIERRIRNINVGRTLNFVFRQMNQEYISILHLVDARLAIIKTFEGTNAPVMEYREAHVAEMESLLQREVRPGRWQAVRDVVHRLLQNVSNYRDDLMSLISEVVPKRGGVDAPEYSYWRVNRQLTESWTDPVTGTSVTVPGIILDATALALRTDGVICEALLGQGEALDSYSRGLQSEAVAEKHLANASREEAIEDAKQRVKIVGDGDGARADLYARLHPAPPAVTLTVTPARAPDTP